MPERCEYCGALTTRAADRPYWTGCMVCNLRAKMRHYADETTPWNWLFFMERRLGREHRLAI